MKTTSNLGLKKPEGTDLVDIDDLNDNADILDTSVKSLQDHAADAVKHITAAERAAWNAKASTAAATTAAAGLMSAGDKSKLDGVAAGANAYVHPATHPPGIIAQDASNRFVSDTEKSTWNAKASTAAATSGAAGLMSAGDKAKLDGIAAGANVVANSASNGVITINGTNATVYTHPNHTGDVTSTGDGVTAIAPGVIVDADVNAAAAIAWSKLSKIGASLADLPTRSAADLSSGTLPAARLPAISGDITMAAGAGTASITAGAIVNADINAAAAIDATKIGGGIVSSAEFGYLDGVMAPIQGQINGKANLSTTPQQTTADITYYVRTDGNDSNTGLANTAGGAFKTIGKAVSIIPQVVNHTVAVNVAAGTYAEDVLISGTNGAGHVAFNGTSATIRSFTAARCSRVVVSGFTGTTTTQSPFYAYDGGKCDFNNCITTVSGSPASGVAIFNQNANIEGCTISNRGTAIQVEKGQVTVVNCTGTGNATAILPSGGALVNTAGTVPSGASNGTNGGVVNPWGDNTFFLRSSMARTHTVQQSLAASTQTKINYSGSSYDTLSETDTNGRFTAKALGVYAISGALSITTTVGAGAGYVVQLGAYVNGTDVAILGKVAYNGTSYTQISGCVLLRLNAGDYVDLYAYSSTAVVTSPDGRASYLLITRVA